MLSLILVMFSGRYGCIRVLIVVDMDLNRATSFPGGLLGPLDGLDLFDEESSDDSGLDAFAAHDSSVGS